MDQINRVVPVSPVSAAHVYGVDRDAKERPKGGQQEHKENQHDVVELHDEIIEAEPVEDSTEHHDVDISA